MSWRSRWKNYESASRTLLCFPHDWWEKTSKQSCPWFLHATPLEKILFSWPQINFGYFWIWHKNYLKTTFSLVHHAGQEKPYVYYANNLFDWLKILYSQLIIYTLLCIVVRTFAWARKDVSMKWSDLDAFETNFSGWFTSTARITVRT